MAAPNPEHGVVVLTVSQEARVEGQRSKRPGEGGWGEGGGGRGNGGGLGRAGGMGGGMGGLGNCAREQELVEEVPFPTQLLQAQGSTALAQLRQAATREAGDLWTQL